MNRRALTSALAVLLLPALAACSSAGAAAEERTVDGLPVVTVAGATSNPLEQASIEYVRDEIAADYGIAIDYVHIEETRAILEATEKKEVDANVAMHEVYMRAQNEENGFHLAAVVPLFKQRQVLYSDRYDDVADLPDGATVAISTSTVAASTALKFLEQIGLVTVDPDVPLSELAVEDVVDNPKHLKLVPVESVPRALPDTDAATATAFAFDTAGIDPVAEIAGIDGLDEYALQLVVHQDSVDDPEVSKLAEAFADPRLAAFVTENYGDLVTPLER
ncbi:NLPA lipoprotein [Xylanimonas cellulosilytica DSM 15894]|uniref:NLPA lipoprotein n=1 Tax=Xylanimonas cellulosilytica (strain DSM 15894 / JCM 12276 / CECT 5975 / KCTC 9989 / LMG 20990 / NBRC 107835 / XIL07) TaxID=446471 RepID=D1BXF8_XYLCX|nr:MetQ/NlpA family ABC transporter substrate-binding protein [Xylanimonas cellulosilytica]ACZ29768.1 NLPA lipoprotein [Xylanimonas cellulosilytica DSM 15894]